MQIEIQNITSKDAWNLLKQINTYLVDVRTKNEWNTVGIPDISELNKKTLFITWCVKDMSMHQKFLDDLNSSITDKNSHVIFICKSGGRSAAAASLALQIGYKNCYNIIDGFEGSHYGPGWNNNNTLLYSIID
jgi:rhodanese-related sulfurtransferase